jgi:hypothetical protein
VYSMSPTISARVVLQSRNAETGTLLTTLRVFCPKFILAEINTHRLLSRNFSSSRAIPAKTTRSRVLANPVIPVSFGQNQSGMQSSTDLSGLRLWAAQKSWMWSRYPACLAHWVGEKAGLHKQVCNRIVEPWVWAEGVISGTDWENFYKLRCHSDTQPEFQDLAVKMRNASVSHEPQTLRPGLYHLPFILEEEYGQYDLQQLKVMSVARCARVSYYLRDGARSSYESDLKLFDRLAGSDPKHLSPFEHVACCSKNPGRFANFKDWIQFRQEIES